MSPLTVAVTGAAGGIGSALRTGLDPALFTLRLLDIVPTERRHPGEDVRTVDLRDLAATEDALAGVDAVVHLAARAHEASFDQIQDSNVRTTWSVYEAARRQGVRRVVFASSIHVSGFYPWGETVAPGAPSRPDTFYALSKLWGEHLGSMYADRYGLEVVNLRIIGFGAEPVAPGYLWGWLSHGDTVRLVTAALTAPVRSPLTCYGVSANTRSFFSTEGWDVLGYHPQDDAEAWAERWPGAEHPALQGGEFTDPDYVGD
ncbi:uronate dehydrogenase [Motilibacter peucedani]|uniref:Uronate dehydrogenase n=1 Tax=Motilibacter peucedani TaxID=598650 RepID=A0A420XS18_9ACTN|nr:NAD(P)-dependent oxidoreductase [Motilibacter peucedani]RKS77678.1 uronate dehydrogenase [Motilibacter peucedani]